MTEHRNKIAKEELKKCVNHLKEMFLPYLFDKSKNPRSGGVAESWIYEMSAGEETVEESAVKLLEKNSSESFLRIAEIMSDLRLPMCDVVLKRLLSNENLETGKRVNAANLLMKGWNIEVSEVTEDIKKILELKKGFLEFNAEDNLSAAEPLKSLINALDSEELYAGLILVLQETDTNKLFPKLEKLVGLSADFDLTVVKVFLDIPGERCLEMLEKIFLQTGERKVKKEINKAIFKLKKQGIFVDEEKFREKKRDPLSAGSVETGGYVSAMIDGGNIQLAIFYINHSVNGYQLFNALRSVKEGLLDFSVNKVSKKGVKKYLDYLRNERNTPVFSVSAEHCRYLLEESVKVTMESGKECSRHYEKWKDFIGKHIECPEDSEIYKYFDKKKLAENSSLALLDEMNPQELFSLALINYNEFSVVYEKYLEHGENNIILKESLKGEVLCEKKAEIMQTFFNESRRKITSRKIEELSLLLYLSDKKEDAEKFLCLAIEANSALKPSDSVFLTRLLDIYIERYKSEHEAGNKEKSEASLIVNPYEKES